MIRRTQSPRSNMLLLGAVALAHLSIGGSTLEASPLWKKLVPRQRVPADPGADYSLTEDNGPWLILAASFNGPEGERQARELVQEFRSRHNLPAFYYGMTFKLDDVNSPRGPGRGLDDYGAPIRRRYKRGDQVIQHAVLVGEFPRIDDPEAQRLLAQVKTMTPETLQVDDGEDTHQSLAAFRRQMGAVISRKIGKPIEKGPMSHAFLTRNQLLPREYFVPPGVDPDIAKWNEKLEYSLLDCPGSYSIRVATFKGRSFLKDLDNPVHQRIKKATDDDPLVRAAHNAHDLAVALRTKGWEAYEFHDRHESIVTVGSFDEMHQMPDGRLLPKTRDAKIIVHTFGAMSPQNVFNRPAAQDIAKERQVKQQFQRQFSDGKVAEGFHPKRFIGMPFDIHPAPIEVPQRGSISSAYARH